MVEYNSHTSNLTEIKRLLESADSQSALSMLGEFWLFGFPASPDNPHLDRSLSTPSGFFKRNLTKAH